MNSGPSTRISRPLAAALLCVCVAGWAPAWAAAPATGPQAFDTPQQAADAIIAAGGSVIGVYTVLNRAAGADRLFEDMGWPFQALFGLEDLEL